MVLNKDGAGDRHDRPDSTTRSGLRFLDREETYDGDGLWLEGSHVAALLRIGARPNAPQPAMLTFRYLRKISWHIVAFHYNSMLYCIFYQTEPHLGGIAKIIYFARAKQVHITLQICSE